ncbi:MAG: ABC transporter ATP-binding protein [Clostridiales bacterium]|nr:ABC transporter ATP-binding protein [Clostridiales bacterium]MDY4060221.1 ABC transporter ATP-binding protein [Anaerovoracaceae bacterium]
MKNWLKEKFALTDQGAKDLVVASRNTFFSYIWNMVPAMVLMFLLDWLVMGHGVNKWIYVGISVITVVIMYILMNIEYKSLYTATYKESENLRIDIARTMRELPLSYFSKHNVSDLAQTIMSDVTAIEHAMSHAVAKTIGFSFFFVVISVMLIAGNWQLGLAVVLPLVLCVISIFLSRNIQRKYNKKYYDVLRESSDNFQETIELQQEIQSLGMADEVNASMKKKIEDAEKIHIKGEGLSAVFMVVANAFLYLSLVVVIIVGVTLFSQNRTSLLYVIGYLLAAIKVKEGAEAINMAVFELIYINSMVTRVKELRNTETQKGEDTDLKTFDIEVSHVGFSYDEDTRILSDVSFTAKQGEVTALVGRSGCGKTTMLRLMSRLYDYDSGSIKIDGKDIKEISTESLFKNVSIVFQDVVLFNASVKENIRMGRNDATDEEVLEAARLAGCEDFVSKLEMGYETKIGENGAALSGGERQRISIARAFLKDAPIIILDEIAASLDVGNEKKIQDSLKVLTRGKTVVIISHRLKSVEKVNKIVVLDGGRVEAEGKHSDLISKSKTYRSLVENAKLAEEFCY